MKHPNLVSFAFGVLLTASVAILVGATPPQGSNPSVPRYQIATLGTNLLVLDNQTNRVSLLYKKRMASGTPPDWPWAVDNSFSLEDALTKAEGAVIQPGVGR